MKFKNLTYITYQVFPNEKANTLQTIRMLESLSNCGLNVKLVFLIEKKDLKVLILLMNFTMLKQNLELKR